MPTLFPYNLFISHAWRYHEDYNRMIELLDDASNFTYRNYSVPKDDAFNRLSVNGLEEELKGQIKPVHCVLIISGIYVSYSDWIQFEIDFAKKSNKPIIGIKPWGSERVPLAVQSAANIIVGWNTSTIVSAIREYTK